MDIDYHRYACPDCGALCTMPWDAAWCTHHGSNFQAHPPRWLEADWTRMERVIGIETEPLPEEASQWVVTEQQNIYHFDTEAERNAWEKEHPWRVRIVSEPMTYEDAVRDAQSRSTRPDWEAHTHSFGVMPVDLAEEW